jgi:hypothetical protein
MTLPSNVGYGTVVGRFLLGYADGSDTDPYPDGIPAQGSIFFTPSPANLKDITATPAPVTILPAKVEATLDSDGYLCGFGTTRGIRLVATDDPDLNPVDWTWGVEFRLTDELGTSVPISSFSFSLDAGTTIDLAAVAPVPDANGTYYLIGPQGPTGPANSLSIGTVTTGSAGSSASATITGTAPTQTLSLTIPRGDKGETGTAATATAGSTTTGSAGSSASVTNVGTTSAAVFDFVVPRGDKGDKGDKGDTGATGASGLNWQGIWSNTADYVNDDAVYYNNSSWFASGNPTVGEEPTLSATHWMPLALQGATGSAATATVGTTTTGDAGSSASVTNVGSTSAAVFNFTIPRGDKGDQGDPGSIESLEATLPVTYSSGIIGFDPTYVSFIDGGTA